MNQTEVGVLLYLFGWALIGMAITIFSWKIGVIYLGCSLMFVGYRAM